MYVINNTYSLYISPWNLVHQTKQARHAFHGHTNTHHPKFCIFTAFRWWFVVVTLLTRLAAANHHKPPPKRRKYAGFGTVDIPAIRKSIVLHRQGLATLKEPNYLFLSQILAVVCSGLRWFAVVCLLSTVFTTYRPKFWWWFVVVCGRSRWFAVVCLIVIPVTDGR